LTRCAKTFFPTDVPGRASRLKDAQVPPPLLTPRYSGQIKRLHAQSIDQNKIDTKKQRTQIACDKLFMAGFPWNISGNDRKKA
jgi:hypothetical protein